MKYAINKRFETRVERTPRVLEIAEAFGLGLDAKEFIVFDNLELDVEQGDVVYITGESGGGKSLLLHELRAQMEAGGMTTVSIDDIELLDKPLIEQIGQTTNEGTNFMGMVGINDAYIWLRKPAQLSDGQRYRFRLAKAIESGAKAWFADEFLAVLDRTVAVNVAFNMQKIARTIGATLVVATTHSDMIDDLAPTLRINKKYREKVEVIRAPEGYKQCSN